MMGHIRQIIEKTMSNSESHISIITVDSKSDKDDMDDNMTAIGDIVAYMSPEAALRNIEKEVVAYALPVSRASEH